jgi:hypothetical protein
MILDILVIALIAAMIWMWANQGLFSAFVHLILTVIAGCIAFALWEPFVYGFLINRMPEQAWGLGLLIPFAVSLMALRTVFDKLVPGNLNFHNIADNVGGAFFGYCSGVLTSGLLVIGLQMVGMHSLFGHQGWEIGEGGKATRKASLMIPVDSIAGGFFTFLSAGSMNPIIGNTSLAIYHPDLAREASLHHQSPFWKQGHDSSLRSIAPDNIKVLEQTGYSDLTEVPRGLQRHLKVSPGERLVVIGTEILNQSEAGTVSADAGGRFRVARSQVALLAADGSGRTDYYYPVGYIQSDEFRLFNEPTDFAYSGAASSATYHWVFRVPVSEDPRFLVIKQTRMPLPATANRNVALVDELIREGVQIVGDAPVPAGGDEEDPTASAFAVVSPSLMVRMNRNRLDILKINTQGIALVSGEGNYVPGPMDRFFSDDLAVATIYHDQGMRVVRINMGRKSDNRSVLGRAVQFAGQVAPPELVTADGKTYQSIGYVRREGARTIFKIDPNNKIRSFAELQIGAFAEGTDVFLFFHVDVGKTVVEFRIGNIAGARERINPPLIVR